MLGQNGNGIVKEVEAKNPWELKTILKDAEGGEYQTNLTIVKDKTTGDFIFTFSRISGDFFKYKKIWQPMEQYFLFATEFDIEEEEEEEEEDAEDEKKEE